MKITFWGTRGSVSSPGPDTLIYGGNTTCLELTLSSGRAIVIDSGTGIRRLGDKLLQSGEPLDLILLVTHIHWDHIVGFPFFGPIFNKNSRIVVDGAASAIEGLKHVFSNSYLDGTWPIRFEDLSAEITRAEELWDGKKVFDDTVVESRKLHHPQGGVGFRFTEDTGSFVFLTDNELLEDGGEGISFKDFIPFCRDADVLVHDCQYLAEEIEMRRGWGHSDVASVARLAMESNVKRLFLFHHDPWRKDREVTMLVEKCEEIFDRERVSIQVEGAREDSHFKV